MWWHMLKAFILKVTSITKKRIEYIHVQQVDLHIDRTGTVTSTLASCKIDIPFFFYCYGSQVH